jgi:hypothetical protein
LFWSFLLEAAVAVAQPGGSSAIARLTFVNHEAPPGHPQGPQASHRQGARHEADPRLALRDGKVIEHWSVRDDLGQALQLGLMDQGRA